MELTIAYLGDIVGRPGREAVVAAVPDLRAAGHELIIANAENARNGSGLAPRHFRELRDAGVDALTLGDHCFRDPRIFETLDHPDAHLCRPANLPADAPGKSWIRLTPDGCGPLYVLCVLGRIFMSMPGDSPFAGVDRVLGSIPETDAIVVVEIHAEATSEKQALAWHCRERWTDPSGPVVVAVVGSHTHVLTDDARLLDDRVATITDLGMCGGTRGIIGRTIEETLRSMRTQVHTPFKVAHESPAVSGVSFTIDAASRRPLRIGALRHPTA